MDRAKGVVGDHAAEGEQVARAEHLLRRDTGFATGEERTAHGDILHVAAAAFGNTQRDVCHTAGHHEKVMTDEAIADDRHDERVRANWGVGDLERTFGAGERMLSGRLHFHEHRGERRASARFEDVTGDAPGALQPISKQRTVTPVQSTRLDNG
jgi:hypothetical protein